jgi:hypothetical protein
MVIELGVQAQEQDGKRGVRLPSLACYFELPLCFSGKDAHDRSHEGSADLETCGGASRRERARHSERGLLQHPVNL